jgi:endonuclease YncB( thermonuclease family)
VPCKVKQSPLVSDTVVSVLDGDTIKVLHNSRPERIRLSGIDCPEKAKHTASA